MRLTDKGKYFSLNIDEDIRGEYCPNASLSDCIEKLGQLEDIEEKTNIPFSQIASLKKGDIVYFKQNALRVHEGTVSSINFKELYITILDGKTFIDFMLFNQYGEDRKTPYHCWCGAWALTREELEK